LSSFFDSCPRNSNRDAKKTRLAGARGVFKMRRVTPPRLRVLIADVASEDARLRAILQGDDLRFVRTTREMEQALGAADFDLGIVCMMFDESRMFETLGYMRGRGVPVTCIRGNSASKHNISMERYRQTVDELGANALIDFVTIPHGSAGNDHIRRQLYGCVHPRDLRQRSTVYTRALHHAVACLGSLERLANALGVTAENVAQWLDGSAFPPYPAYMRALDIVADHSASSTTLKVVPGTTIPPRSPGSTLP
jgi:hypothetical protein